MFTNVINKLSTQYDPSFAKKWTGVCINRKENISKYEYAWWCIFGRYLIFFILFHIFQISSDQPILKPEENKFLILKIQK